MYSARISRRPDGTIDIVITKGAPPEDGDPIIDVLYGDDQEILKALAVKFVNERLS